MPRVPQEKATIVPSALPNARVGAAVSPNTYGAGFANVGQDLGLALFVKHLRDANDTAVLAADGKLAVQLSMDRSNDAVV